MFQLLILLGIGALALRKPKTKKDTLVITDDPTTARKLEGGGMIMQTLDIDLTEGQDQETYASTNDEWGGTDDIGGAGNRVFDDGKDDDSGLGGGGSVPVDRPDTSRPSVSYIKDLDRGNTEYLEKQFASKEVKKAFPTWEPSPIARRSMAKPSKAPEKKKFTGFDGVEDDNDYGFTGFDGIND